MNYNKNIISGYLSIQVIVTNLIFLSFLIFSLTDKNTIPLIINDSIMIYIITSMLFYFLLRQDKFSYNIPNMITNYRLIINCFILILVMNINYYNHYLLLVLSVISLLLDGVDGYLSRFLKQQTDFGETFDQEVDNFLIFILSFSLVYNYSFCFMIMCVPIYRYIFLSLVKYGYISNGNLPSSYFRKIICVSMIIVLILSNYLYTIDAIIYLLYVIIILLTYSFVRDTMWLYRRRNV